MTTVLHVEQEPGSPDCAGCAAAMATGTTLADFKAFAGKPGPYDDRLVFAYLRLHGMDVGIASFAFGSCGVRLNERESLQWEWSAEGNRALLAVRSQNYPGVQHMVYWDGEWVYDPAPGSDPEGRPLAAYAVVQVFPLSVRQDHPLTDNETPCAMLDPAAFPDPMPGSYLEGERDRSREPWSGGAVALK